MGHGNMDLMGPRIAVGYIVGWDIVSSGIDRNISLGGGRLVLLIRLRMLLIIVVLVLLAISSSRIP